MLKFMLPIIDLFFSLGPFGAVFEPISVERKEPVMYIARPGLRLWHAKPDGKVSATYIFKDLVTDLSKNVSLLAMTTGGLVPHDLESCQFGPLLVYQDSYVLSHHGPELYVIDPPVGAFTSYHISLGHIEDVAVCGDEVFILRRTPGRVLIRLAHKPQNRIGVCLNICNDMHFAWFILCETICLPQIKCDLNFADPSHLKNHAVFRPFVLEIIYFNAS